MRILFVVREIDFINPMGVQLLSALAKSGGRPHETFLFALAWGDVLGAVKEHKPDIVAYCGVKTGEHLALLEAVERIHSSEPRIFQVMGGPHATYFPGEVGRSNLDALCVGEGEHAWLELLDALEAGRKIDSIANLVIKGGDPARTPIRDRVTDLDALPFLDWDLVLKNTHLGAFPMRSFMVSRGCPFRCSYCFEHKDNALYQGKGPVLRRMSVRRVCDELAFLKKAYPDTQRIKEYSDVFPVFPGTDDRWLEGFAEEYPKRVGLPFHALVRADLIARDPHKARLLKIAGCDSVTMSIETGNEGIRNDPGLLDRSMRDCDMKEAFAIFRNLGIPVFANCILGIPVPRERRAREGKEPLDYDIETFDICVDLKPAYVETGVFHPFPGTRLAESAIAQKAFDGDYDALHSNYSFLSPLSCFTDDEKRRQLRLCFLTTVIVLFRGYPRLSGLLRDFFVNRLSKWPTTTICYWMYYFAKVYAIKTHIYPMRFSWSATIKNAWRSARLEYSKRMTHSGRVKA